MEIGTRDAISIKLKSTFSTKKPEVEKLDAEMGICRLLPDTVSCKKEYPNPEPKPHLVTSIRNNTSSSPYNLRVTGKWTVRNQTRKFSAYSTIVWFSFLIFLLGTNTYFLRKFHQQNEEYLRAVTVLQNMMQHLEKETQGLQERLNSLRHNNVPSIRSSLFALPRVNELSFGSETEQSVNSQSELLRTKRSNDEVHSDRKERQKKTVAVQFSGSRPYGFYLVPPEGILGPWIESTNDFSNIEKFGARLKDHNSSLEINRDGTYMIYAQVTYQSINVSNSFSINVIPNTDRLLSQPITTCSSFGKIIKDGEISCYTSVVQLLNAGDIVFVQQAQPDREIIFTKSYTYFGLVYLN